MNEPKEKPGNVVDFSTLRKGPEMRMAGLKPFAEYLTFRNVVLALALATFLIFLGSVASARIAFLFAALLGLLGLLVTEMTSRRKWEANLALQLQRMASDYERLVRETARNRNDLMVLKRQLAEAGDAARSHGKAGGGDLEQRMVRTLAEQLSRLSEVAVEEAPDRAASAVEAGVIGADSPLMMATQETVGRLATDAEVLAIVNAAVRQDRIDLFLQPIVALPQRKFRFHEMFSRIRIRDDVYLPAERYIEVAMRQDLVPAIDNLLLLRGLQLIREVPDDAGAAIFCNITSLTLNDPKFMGDLVEFIAQNRGLAPRLVFELGQRDLASMSPDVLPILEGLSRLGCRFSMDQVRSLSFDFDHMAVRHIRFVKADAPLVLKEMRERGGASRLKRLKAEMDRNGIDFIVTKIESERELLELLDLGIDFGQGFLFGKPAPELLPRPGKA
jgi:cyclic-di-GMP phosphodiesterase, flagellum assembly factor TipF